MAGHAAVIGACEGVTLLHHALSKLASTLLQSSDEVSLSVPWYCTKLASMPPCMIGSLRLAACGLCGAWEEGRVGIRDMGASTGTANKIKNGPRSLQ